MRIKLKQGLLIGASIAAIFAYGIGAGNHPQNANAGVPTLGSSGEAIIHPASDDFRSAAKEQATPSDAPETVFTGVSQIRLRKLPLSHEPTEDLPH